MRRLKIDSLLFSEKSESFQIYDLSGLVGIDKIREDVMNITAQLEKMNLQPRENIAIVCDNHSCFLSALMAIVSVGAVAMPLDPQINATSLNEIVEKFNIRYSFIYGKRAEKLYHNDEIENTIFFYDGTTWISPDCVKQRVCSNHMEIFNDGLEPAIILLTSGTADLMHKGVLISHEGIFNNIESIIDYMHPLKEEGLYIAKSLAHVSSVIGELLMGLAAGMTLYIYNPVVPYSVIIKRIIDCRPDYVVVNPTLLYHLMQYLENNKMVLPVKGIYTCGGFSGAELINKARKTFAPTKIYNMYGLTEAGPRVTSQTDELDNYEAGFAGKVIKNVSIKIVNDNGECDVYEKGWILVKSNALMLGYYGNPELTNAKIRDGWLFTGDVGYLNNNQELYVLGRADDVVIRSGKNINLNIIEELISGMDEIKECIVFSIPDSINQNKIICAYVKNGDKNIGLAMVRERCLIKLFPYECPQQMVEWDVIPKTNSNKKSRRRASDLFLKGGEPT
jgi:long-chain acyl-CoA synthetase